jgi:hypothetical protein
LRQFISINLNAATLEFKSAGIQAARRHNNWERRGIDNLHRIAAADCIRNNLCVPADSIRMTVNQLIIEVGRRNVPIDGLQIPDASVFKNAGYFVGITIRNRDVAFVIDYIFVANLFVDCYFSEWDASQICD